MTEERVLAGQFVLHKSSLRERERESERTHECVHLLGVCSYFVNFHGDPVCC